MGSLSNVLGTFGPTLTMGGIPGFLVNTAATFASRKEAAAHAATEQKVAMEQLLARQQMEEAQAADKLALQQKNLEIDAAANEERRRNALRRAVARQKTLFSAQGISPGDSGSNEAVLLGLYDESKNEQDVDDRLNSLRQAALDQGLAQTKQKNLLQSTQLAEQQNLYRILNGY